MYFLILIAGFVVAYSNETSNQTCTNECYTSGLKQCFSNYTKTCGNYDLDSCLEWSSGTYCAYGCSSGVCNSVSNQTNITCSPSWKCQSAGYKGYQSVDCQWNNVAYCEYGCSDGICNSPSENQSNESAEQILDSFDENQNATEDNFLEAPDQTDNQSSNFSEEQIDQIDSFSLDESSNDSTEQITDTNQIDNLSFKGCIFGNKNYSLGYRLEGNYCNAEDGTFVQQKVSNSTCENNFECSSNFCSSGKCIDANLFQKIGAWFKKIFGGRK